MSEEQYRTPEEESRALRPSRYEVRPEDEDPTVAHFQDLSARAGVTGRSEDGQVKGEFEQELARARDYLDTLGPDHSRYEEMTHEYLRATLSHAVERPRLDPVRSEMLREVASHPKVPSSIVPALIAAHDPAVAAILVDRARRTEEQDPVQYRGFTEQVVAEHYRQSAITLQLTQDEGLRQDAHESLAAAQRASGTVSYVHTPAKSQSR